MGKYDIRLFCELNDRYRSTPLVPAPNPLTGPGKDEQAMNRVRQIQKQIDLRGKRVLEIGCGRGHLATAIAATCEAQVTGVDIVNYPEWQDDACAGVDLRKMDLTTDDISSLGHFDAIVSLVVMEHVLHPYSMLTAMYNLLRPGGQLYLSANLYRGPKASHRYRDIFFPWPHLLFTDDVFAQFYRLRLGPTAPRKVSSWVNKLTYAHYKLYFDQLGFESQAVWLSPSSFDESAYLEHSEVLERYPIFDLSHDFIYAHLTRPELETRPLQEEA